MSDQDPESAIQILRDAIEVKIKENQREILIF